MYVEDPTGLYGGEDYARVTDADGSVGATGACDMSVITLGLSIEAGHRAVLRVCGVGSVIVVSAVACDESVWAGH